MPLQEQKLQQVVLNAPIGVCILDAETLIAELVNDKFLEVAGKQYEFIIGNFYWNAFAEVRSDYEESLNSVVQTGIPFHADEVKMRLIRNGFEDTVYVSFVYVPIKDAESKVVKVAIWVLENTKRVEAKLNAEVAKKALQEAYDSSNQQKRLYETITSATPDLIYVFDLNYRFTYANTALLTMWGRTWETAIGNSLLENGYEPWHADMHEREIDTIVTTKQPVRGEVAFPHATLGKRIYDYILVPVLNEQGEVEAVAGTTRDVTERKHWEDLLAKNAEELRAANEELAAANEEQSVLNEELAAANEELARVNEELLTARIKIEEGETALRLAINAANFGTWFIHSKTREFLTDGRLKELFGYYDYEDLSIEQALAQITDEYRQYVADKLEKAIYKNGDYDVTYPVIGFHDKRLRWLRAIGNLKADHSGEFSAFTGVVMDITDQVLAKEALQSAYEQLRLSKEAAQLGSFDMDLNKGTMEWDARCRELFGISHSGPVTYDVDFVTGLHPDDRERITSIINKAFIKSVSGGIYDVEYRTVGAEDKKIRWVRAKGQVYFDQEDKPERFVGSVLEITEQKEDELRKNDFIGMVSHELKTPLTSLTAIIQVANAKLKNSEDPFLSGAMEKAGVQVKRMSKMINGFLNISRLESAKISIDKIRFDLEELIQEVVNEIRLTTASHVIDFVRSKRVIIEADQEKIGSVITNLISNAIKYSPKGKIIIIRCEINGQNVQVSVTDEGIGLKPQDKEKVFDRYFRVEDTRTKHISGFGIGLYLSAEIIRRHEGEIGVESEFGSGATFYFSLPINNRNS